MDIKLKQYNVKIKEEITYGEQEDIEKIFLDSAKVNMKGLADIDANVSTKAKYKTLEVFIVEIKEGDIVIPFSQDWLRALPVSDGNKLVDAVNEVHNSKKK
jgi:hypothetical protein